MSFVKYVRKLGIVFLEQLSHLSRARMQELKYISGLIERVAENIKDDINVLYFPKLVNRPCMHNLLHFYL